jgi:hypothetical protein
MISEFLHIQRRGRKSIAAPSTVSLMVAADACVANHMFLLVKNRRSVWPRISVEISVLPFDVVLLASPFTHLLVPIYGICKFRISNPIRSREEEAGRSTRELRDLIEFFRAPHPVPDL